MRECRGILCSCVVQLVLVVAFAVVEHAAFLFVYVIVALFVCAVVVVRDASIFCIVVVFVFVVVVVAFLISVVVASAFCGVAVAVVPLVASRTQLFSLPSYSPARAIVADVHFVVDF